MPKMQRAYLARSDSPRVRLPILPDSTRWTIYGGADSGISGGYGQIADLMVRAAVGAALSAQDVVALFLRIIVSGSLAGDFCHVVRFSVQGSIERIPLNEMQSNPLLLRTGHKNARIHRPVLARRRAQR